MTMQSRSTQGGAGAEDYRYAYNGMEHDGEVSGDGNSYTTEFRQYDPRLGRWKSLDPLMAQFPWMSPYVAFDNNPVYYVDPYGLSSEGGDGIDPNIKVRLDETINYLPEMEWEGKTVKFSVDAENTITIALESGDKIRVFADVQVVGNRTPIISKESQKVEQSESNATATGLVLTGVASGELGGMAVFGPLGAIGGLAVILTENTMNDLAAPTVLSSVEISSPISIPIDYVSTDGVTTTGSPDGYITLFRGVNENHPDYFNAQVGRASPRGGTCSEVEHNMGNTNSPFTSWTVAPWTAYSFATKKSTSHGIVLVKSFHISEVNLNSPDKFHQGEILVKGEVSGAIPVPTRTPLLAK